MKLSLVVLAFLPFVLCQNFDKTHVGVAFGPYTKHKENGMIPYYDSYTTDEIKGMLSMVSEKFTHISTYGMGVKDYNVNKPWDQADAEALVARAAAMLNNEKRNRVVDVALGIFQKEDQNIQNKEVNNAFLAASDANNRAPGTVWGFVFTNEYIDTVEKGTKVLGMIRYDRNRAHQNGLQVGTRINTCGYIEKPNSQMYKVLSDIARESDFVMCNIYPSKEVVQNGVQKAVQEVGKSFLAYRYQFQMINPSIQVIIGETGWPSEGDAFNSPSSLNSVQNLGDFWSKMGNWASRNAVRTYMFEAIDEPWKNEFPAESHYGWWYRRDNGARVYIEKVSKREIQADMEADVEAETTCL